MTARIMTIRLEFKPFFILTLLLLGIQGCVSTKDLLDSKKQIKIIPGKGFDNFQIKSTTKANVIKKLGNQFIDTTYLYPSRQIRYEQYGVSFIYGVNDTIWNIIFYYPFNGVTNDGIVLNKSTMKDVEKVYGELWWQIGYPFSHWSSMHPGIEYQVEKEGVEKNFPLDKDKHINKTITQIEIFDNEHFYNKDGSKKNSS
jgi:hypothetical protein